jgi:GntR family transcriptional regulator/MocR family aminotransferase
MYIRRSRAEPLTTQLYRGIREAILSGALAPESRVPSTRDLALSEGVARNTALASTSNCFRKGTWSSGAAPGTYVAPELPENLSTRLRSTPATPTAPPEPPRLSRRGQRLVPLAPVSWAPVTPAVAVDFRYGPTALDDFPRRSGGVSSAAPRGKPRHRISTTARPAASRSCGKRSANT